MTTLDAFDTVAWSETFAERLDAAALELGRKQGFKDEKDWLTQAQHKVTQAREGLGPLGSKLLRLPELEPVREEHARTLQGEAVDAVERLQAGITFHVGSRAPLLEALYGKLKLPVLRRCDAEDFERFCADFEKKLSSGYAKRMLSDPGFAFAQAVVEQVLASFGAWRGAFSSEPLPDGEAQALREELLAHARKLELPLKQARLLAEAALSPLKDAFENSGLASRPKRRSPKPAVTEADDADVDAGPSTDDAEPPSDDAAAEDAVAAEPAPSAPSAPSAPPKPEGKPTRAKRAKATP